jgi:UDP-N-acetylglucosamine 2-epimerase (non-hydrolysing)
LTKVIVVFGTRPEAIKLAPVIEALKAQPESFEVVVCVTGQHREMLDQVLAFFGIVPDFDLGLMRSNQSLNELSAKMLDSLDRVYREVGPDLVCVQGDTTSTVIGALSAFHSGIPVMHIEAGLRSGNKRSPFPEEINRIITGHIADFHFAPTQEASENLRREGVDRNIWVTGNTAIDALHLGLKRVRESGAEHLEELIHIAADKRLVLVTGHRRESFGEPFEAIIAAIRELAERFADIQIVFPVHLNPRVREPVYERLSGISNVSLIEPVDYPALIWLMEKSYLVLTDSGGIQEEAPTLGKPVLVMREVTERKEGIAAGTAVLVGSDTRKIVSTASQLLTDHNAYEQMARAVNPYGDGQAARRIVETLVTTLDAD